MHTISDGFLKFAKDCKFSCGNSKVLKVNAKFLRGIEAIAKFLVGTQFLRANAKALRGNVKSLRGMQNFSKQSRSFLGELKGYEREHKVPFRIETHTVSSMGNTS